MPVFLINLLIGIALTVVSTLAQQLFKSKQEQQARGFRGAFQSGGKVPQSILVGTIGVPGKLEYRNTFGNSGETPNAYLVDVISFGDLPVTALTRLWVNSTEGTIASTGHVTQGYPVTYKSKNNRLWVEFFDGTQTTANSYLTGRFGSDPDRPWTGDMIGRQVPYMTATALIDENVWSGFPTYMAELQGLKLYDPRKDSTAGGTGSQRWADRSTWAFSDNPMVIVYNILRGIHDADGNHVWGGQATAYQLPYAPWAAAMDACDETVALDGGGTERRFRGGREIFLNERPADVITEFLQGANARIAHAGGKYYPLVGVPDTADGSFSDADVIVTEGTTLECFPNLDQVVNGATATYLEPAQAWESKETAPYYRSDLEAEDDGRRQLLGADLTTVFSGTQAQRILKASVEESRRFRRHVVMLSPYFGRYRPLQVLAWTSEANGYEAKLFLITSKVEDPWGNVLLGLQEIDPADHDWTPAEDEQPLSFAPMTPILPPAQPATDVAVSPYVFPGSAGEPRRPGILLEYRGAMPDVRAVLYEVREDFGDGNTVATGEITYDTVNVNAAQPLGGQWTLPNEDYEVRARYVPPDGSGRETEWSAWLSVTTPDVRLGPKDIAIEFGDIAEELAQQIDWIGAGVRSAMASFKRFNSLLEEQDLANFNDRKMLRRELELQVGELRAGFNEIIELALGEGGAIAQAFSTIYAALGGSSAHVGWRVRAVATPAGVSARWAVEVSTDGDVFRFAGMYIDIPEDTEQPTRVVIVADQFVVASDDNSVIKPAFVVENGEIKFIGARAGRITDVTGEAMVLDFDNLEIYMEK